MNDAMKDELLTDDEKDSYSTRKGGLSKVESRKSKVESPQKPER
jgi:hypothetical protein